MSVQGVGRVAAVTGSVVVWLVVLGGALGPTRTGSAQPAQLEPGVWYDVVPASPQTAAMPSPISSPLLASVTSATAKYPAGRMVWLAAIGCSAILAAGALRMFLPASNRNPSGAYNLVPPRSPRGDEKKC